MEFTQYQTGNNAVNWLLARVKVTDHSDKHGSYFIGEFKGTLPYRMVSELYDLQKANGGLLWKQETEDYTVSCHFSNGQHKSTFTKVTFSVSYIQNEDLAPID